MTGRATAALALGAAGLVVAAPFFWATTFIGDDHVFLAFARHVSNPFVPFVSDSHGGEYYRPVWMLLWWCLARLGGHWPFELGALGLHTGAAWLLVMLLRALGRPRPVQWIAAALFVLAPSNLETAYWYSASTDLLATGLVLASLVAVLDGRGFVSGALALGAYLSKESAYVLPILALIALGARQLPSERPDARRPRSIVAAVAPLLVSLAVAVAARRLVLGGWGGSVDAHAGPLGIGLQIASGFCHLFTGNEMVPEPLAFAAGATAVALAALALGPQPGGWRRFAPLAFALAAAAPLVATGWAVGARYFYLPAVGLCWAAGEALAGAAPAAPITCAAILLVLGGAAAARRHENVASYDARVAAARRAVAAGAREGHRVFHVDGGIKDLDLAVKEAPALEAAGVLVLADVPASFVILPADLAPAASILVAAPPLPPSGAYRFGPVRVVGLARRGDDPDLTEVLARFPDLRFIRLRTIPGGRIIARDLTDQIKRRLDGAAAEGQE